LLPNLVTDFLMSALFIAYWRGWEQARYTMVLFVTIAVVVVSNPLPTQPAAAAEVAMQLIVPPVLALVVAGPAWVVGSAVVTLAGLLIKAGGAGFLTEPFLLTIYVVIVCGLVLSRVAVDNIQRLAAANRQIEAERARAEAERARAEQQATELAHRNAEQQRLLDLVATLETPIITLAEGVVLAPIVGTLDPRRAQALMTRLLETVSTRRVRRVILDVAGVTVMDSAVAQALLKTIQALQLLGCTVALTGISAPVALTMGHLNLDLAGVTTVHSPQDAL
jgi:anti-anti-sigma factor